jgi:hypothetical protein
MQTLPQHTQSKVSEVTEHGKASTSLSSDGDSKLYILQYSGRAELTHLAHTHWGDGGLEGRQV